MRAAGGFGDTRADRRAPGPGPPRWAPTLRHLSLPPQGGPDLATNELVASGAARRHPRANLRMDAIEEVCRTTNCSGTPKTCSPLWNAATEGDVRGDRSTNRTPRRDRRSWISGLHTSPTFPRSPGQARSSALQHRWLLNRCKMTKSLQPTDVFAWGLVSAYAGLGRSPFGAGRAEVLVHRIIHDEPDLGALEGPLRTEVSRCLHKDPALPQHPGCANRRHLERRRRGSRHGCGRAGRGRARRRAARSHDRARAA